MIHVISLGAGVQSSTMALMAAHGEITPMPECAIFADTGAEPRGVYDWLDWLETQLPFPVHRVTAGSLKQHVLDAMEGKVRMDGRPPFFTETGGPINRQCTTKYKIAPITKRLKELRGDAPVTRWVGISTDEASRAKPAREKWEVNRWPLLEIGMSRTDCLSWMHRHGYDQPPKSACTFCPYRDTAHWRDMKQNDPQSWAEAVMMDEAIRQGSPQQTKPRRWFIHYSHKPLAEIDFGTARERGQLSLMTEECEGMCGV